MTLENLGPLIDELCAVLQSKGCTVREVAVTYAPLTPEEALAPGFSSSRVDAAGTLPPPRGVPGVTTAQGRCKPRAWFSPKGENAPMKGGRRTATKDAFERRAESMTPRRDVRRSAALSCMG